MEFTEKNPKYFYELNEFKQLYILEDSYKVILNELLSVTKNIKDKNWFAAFPSYVVSKNENTWKTLNFIFFGIKNPVTCSLCPETFKILNKIPGLITTEFSYLPGNTKIKPHKGFSKMVLRVHLGLIIPKDCGIRVGNETKIWEEGKLFVFDDSFEHEAWNNSKEDRFILMLDIVNPLWEYTAQEICKFKIENLNDEFMLSLYSKEQWMEFYNKGEFTAFPIK